MLNPRYLTKSRFKLAIECPTKLFYYGKPEEYMDTSAEDAFLQALAEGGFQVGEMAKLLYPGGHEITSKVHQEALDQTAELLRQDAVVLYEPAFLFKGLFIRVDILVKTGNHFQLIEVKAKSYNPNEPDILGKRGGISTSYLPYLQDIAFQRYVLSNAHPEARIESFLMMADKSKASPVDGLNQLFKIKRRPEGVEVILAPDAATIALQCRDLLFRVPVDEYINTIFSEGIEFPGGFGMLPELSEAWAEAYRADRKISPVPTAECASTRKSALLQQRKILLNTKTLSQDDIGYKTGDQGLTITERQWMQITGEIPEPYNQGGFYLDTVMIQKAMTSWTFPWHMIDFETSTTALPFFKGMRPYESTAFQFSHHIIHADGKVEHAGQFLMAEPNANPNIEFVRALKAELDKDNGTVFRWATHENTILSHVLKQLNASKNPPEDKDALIGFIESILKDGNRAMVDLCDLAKRAYYHPDTKGSSSIKVVLPAVMKTSEFLKEKYSKPIYGNTCGIPSINYVDHTWWIERDGQAVGPYDLLKELGRELSGSATDLDIADGGAAIAAFSRLQFEDLDDAERQAIKLGLLRYCEVDTLAMVMIAEAWREWAKEH